MKRFVLLLIILAAAIVAVMQKDDREERGDTVPEPPSSAVWAQMRVFHDATGGYRIHYPADWKLDDHSRAERLIRADIGKGKTVGIQIRIDISFRPVPSSVPEERTSRFSMPLPNLSS